MKKFLSIKYNAGAFNFSMLFLRVVFGMLLLAKYGYTKMASFEKLQNNFYNFLGMGSRINLVLAIFAEVLCALFIILGLFTRFAAAILVIMFLIIIFAHDAGKPFLKSELALLYLGAFVTILLCGPGRISVDSMINK